MTYIKGREKHVEEAVEMVKIETSRPPSRFQSASQQAINVPVIVFGGLAVFGIMTFMVVAMPYMFTYQSPSVRAQELTAMQAQGQALYKSLGCVYCHSQFIRPQDWAMGYTSQPGDFYYSVPHFLGTERTGPSLSQIGGKVPSEWNIFHYKDPRSVSPSSIMPPFAFLSDVQLQALSAYIESIGGHDLEPRAFQPPIPAEYRYKANPNTNLMTLVNESYDANEQTYTGPEDTGKQWAELFDEGKMLFNEKCLRCHGGSGNGQGAYARQTLTHPANLHERISNFLPPGDNYHFWRVSEGVPGTAMPPWGWSQDEATRWKLVTYELSFVGGAIRTVDGGISDDEGDAFNDKTHITPPISGTKQDFETGKALYGLYCAQCHGSDGHGDGPASIKTAGGYIQPEPADFEESGTDFPNYGRWVWKVKEGVETTNMPIWKAALSDDEIFRLIFYIQGFSLPDDYNSKWAPLYSDPFAKNLKR